MDLILKILIFAPPVLFSIILHEVMHGFVAYRMGDPTAKDAGRLTLNPIKHIDLVGTIILPLILILSHTGVIFGWAKPVPVNVMRTRNPRQAMGLVALAGPLTNFTLALISVLLIRLLGLKMDVAQLMMTGQITSPLAAMLFGALEINVVLFVFNLIPIPPLDGGRVAVWLLPTEQARAWARTERYGMFIIFALVIFNPFGILTKLFGSVFKLFLGLL